VSLNWFLVLMLSSVVERWLCTFLVEYTIILYEIVVLYHFFGQWSLFFTLLCWDVFCVCLVCLCRRALEAQLGCNTSKKQCKVSVVTSESPSRCTYSSTANETLQVETWRCAVWYTGNNTDFGSGNFGYCFGFNFSSDAGRSRR